MAPSTLSIGKWQLHWSWTQKCVLNPITFTASITEALAQTSASLTWISAGDQLCHFYLFPLKSVYQEQQKWFLKTCKSYFVTVLHKTFHQLLSCLEQAPRFLPRILGPIVLPAFTLPLWTHPVIIPFTVLMPWWSPCYFLNVLGVLPPESLALTLVYVWNTLFSGT